MYPDLYIYINLIERTSIDLNAVVQLWNVDLNIELTVQDWSKLYPGILKITQSTRLRYFKYRLLF